VVLVGQWIFAGYVGLYHGTLIARKGLEGMGETHMPNGFMPGDSFGNLILAVHLVTAIIIIGGGPLQLIPQLRKSVPKFHRVVGRLYIFFVFFAALAGLYLTWTRPMPAFSSMYQLVAISIEAVLIIWFAMLALRFAILRKIIDHQKWALRLFMVGSGVWSLRIGYMVWFFLEGTFNFKWKPFFDFWSFGSFIIPLAVLELFFLSKTKPQLRTPLACIILFLTLLMALGVFLATYAMWFPRIQKT
jgi:uncharacterized membrane protein